MDIILALCLGVALSAACGFRVFIPPFAMSLAAMHADLPLSEEFSWVGTPAAAITLGIATVIEILAYYVPVVDNFLDTIEIPTAIAVGTLMTAANLGDMDPVLQWSLALLAGGGTAGIIDSFTAVTRVASTGVTGGFGNFFIATTEALSSGVLSILALSVPLLAFALVIGLLIFAITKIVKLFPTFMRKLKKE